MTNQESPPQRLYNQGQGQDSWDVIPQINFPQGRKTEGTGALLSSPQSRGTKGSALGVIQNSNTILRLKPWHQTPGV